MIWRYTKDGNPTEEDNYAVVILHPEAVNISGGKVTPAPNTKAIARGVFRDFKNGSWQEAENSYPCETVFAWLEKGGYPVLPEGVEWRD